MKQIAFLLFTSYFVIAACNFRSKSNSYLIRKINLEIEIPKDLSVSDSISVASQSGSSTETLLKIQSGENNFLLFRYTPCNAVTNISCSLVEAPPLTLSFFADQNGKPKMDTISSTAFIDSLAFSAFKTQLQYEQKQTVQVTVYTKEFKDYLLTLNLVYTDKEIGSKLLQVLNSAKFIK